MYKRQRVGPLVLESELRLKQGRFDDALAATRQAETELSEGGDRWQLRGLYFAWGKAWANEGDLNQAKEFFRREIELNPEALQPYAHLAFALALEGDGPSAGATLQEMTQTNPTPEAYATAVETLQAMKDERSAAALLRYALQQWPDSERLRDLQEP